ncbi:unnamed protein product [Rhodiola kirilowii]
MEKQLPTLIDFFFVESFFVWVARVQDLLSRSKSFIESPSTSKKIVTLSHNPSSNNQQGSSDKDEHQVIELVMERLGLEVLSEDSRLGFDDMKTLFDENEPCLDEVKAAFNVFDQNNDGFIDEKEMKRVMSALGLKEAMRLETCRKMIRDFDENGDGLIDFSEFVKVVEKSFS